MTDYFVLHGSFCAGVRPSWGSTGLWVQDVMPKTVRINNNMIYNQQQQRFKGTAGKGLVVNLFK
eukprot:12998616-Heterocapsa_arctica.AAC.1